MGFYAGSCLGCGRMIAVVGPGPLKVSDYRCDRCTELGKQPRLDVIESIDLTPEELEAVARLLEEPPTPTEALKAAVAERRARMTPAEIEAEEEARERYKAALAEHNE